ncbi:MAG: lyase family protein [Leisingera sp.]
MRPETGSLGTYSVPKEALYGVHSLRAFNNFRLSEVPLSEHPELVQTMAMVKKASAGANRKLGVLPAEKAAATRDACDELLDGQHRKHFIADMVQGGAGTSTNVNANEVIANLALKKLGHEHGDYQHLHPNDDVSKSQSTIDVYPTALCLAILLKMEGLTSEHQRLCDAFEAKASEFDGIAKVRRTQLQDAVPMTLG